MLHKAQKKSISVRMAKRNIKRDLKKPGRAGLLYF